MERERKLQQQRTQFSGPVKRIEACADGLNIRGGCLALVREFLPEFCGEQKARIYGHAGEPLSGKLRAKRLVKGSVDFDGVEKAGEVIRLMKTARAVRRVDDAVPVRV